MQHIRRSATPLGNRCGGLIRSWLLKPEPLMCFSDFSRFAAFSSSSAALAKPIQRLPKSGFMREYNALANHVTKEGLGANGEGVGVSVSTFLEGATVYEVEYCAFSELRRPILFEDQSFKAGAFTLNGSNNVHYSLLSP